MQDVQATLSIGTLIRERYLVNHLIAKSVSGAIYRVVDQRAKGSDRHTFALKEIICHSEQERYQLLFDSIPLRNAHHEAMPRIYHVFNDDRRNRVCMVMDYVEGPDLETVRQQQAERRLTWPEVAKIMVPIVDAVSYLHRQEPPIVHGDIKPANILFAQYEERFMLVGMRVAREQHLDASVSFAISSYTASAQSGKAVDVRTDVYGIGATCYTMLTGTVPPNVVIRAAHFEQGEADLLISANSVIPSIPAHIAQAIQRAMSLQAVERFSSIEEFWQALQTPMQELVPAVDNGLLPTTLSTRVVTEQIPVLQDVQMHVFSRHTINNSGPFFFLKVRAVLLLLLILLSLVVAGAGTWLFVQRHQTSSTIIKYAGTTPRTLITPASNSTVPVVPIVTPTSSPGNYPDVAGSYAGTLADVPTDASAIMIMQGVHQIGGMINGYLTVGLPLKISGPFSGTIDYSKHFQFTVNDATGHPLLFLEGAIQSTTSISGDFYRCTSTSTQEGKCSRASSDYGIWSALLATSRG